MATSTDIHIVLDFRGPESLDAMQGQLNAFMSDIGRKVTPVFQQFIYGPLAPVRRRPRRVQRKIDARRGRAQYLAAVWRHCERGGHEDPAGV